MINDVDTPNWICDVLFVLIKNEKVIYFHNAENKNPTIFLYHSHCLITGRLFGLPTKGFGLEKHIYLAIKATAKSQIIKYLHAVQRKMKTLQFMSEFSTNISYQSYISRVLYSYPLFYHEPNKKRPFLLSLNITDNISCLCQKTPQDTNNSLIATKIDEKFFIVTKWPLYEWLFIWFVGTETWKEFNVDRKQKTCDTFFFLVSTKCGRKK